MYADFEEIFSKTYVLYVTIGNMHIYYMLIPSLGLIIGNIL